MTKSKEFSIATRQVLLDQSEFDEHALEALTRVQAIEAAGGWPEIKYSELHGWQVTDAKPR